jgi:hypothetical protein
MRLTGTQTLNPDGLQFILTAHAWQGAERAAMKNAPGSGPGVLKVEIYRGRLDEGELVYAFKSAPIPYKPGVLTSTPFPFTVALPDTETYWIRGSLVGPPERVMRKAEGVIRVQDEMRVLHTWRVRVDKLLHGPALPGLYLP